MEACARTRSGAACPASRTTCEALYAPNGYAPLWLRSVQPGPPAREAIAVLFEGAELGLDPERYGATELLELHDRLASGAHAPASEAGRFDTTLSLALLRHVSDRHIGLVDPRTLGVELDLTHKQVDLADIVRRAAETGQVRTVVSEADSRLAQYRQLREALGSYRRLAAEAGLQPLPPATKVKVGMPYAGAGDLQRLLTALGDLPAGLVVAEGEAAIYTETLAEGVRRFQQRHGLWVDGVLGTTTLSELNTPLAVRARQLRAGPGTPALAARPRRTGRWSSSTSRRSGPWTWTVAAGDLAPALAMNVVVGRAVRHRDPALHARRCGTSSSTRSGSCRSTSPAGRSCPSSRRTRATSPGRTWSWSATSPRPGRPSPRSPHEVVEELRKAAP